MADRRKEWQDWAEDVAKICSAQVEAIEQVLANGKPELKAQFDQFCQDLQNTIHHHLERAEIHAYAKFACSEQIELEVAQKRQR